MILKLGTNGLVINEFGQILLIQRDDSRTWAPPGGGIEAGELATAGVVREIEEETGLKTVPVRLVAVYFRTESKADTIMFVFRCLVRGGELTTSAESLQVGYLPPNELPTNILGIHQAVIQQGYLHKGGPPILRKQNLPLSQRLSRDLLYRWRDYRRKQRGEEPHQESFRWQAGAFVILRNEIGEVLWAQRRDNGRWNLPGGGIEKGEPPWEAAIREAKEETGLDIAISRLTGVYTKEAIGEVVFNFEGEILGGELQENDESQGFRWEPAGSPPPNSLLNHIARVQDAINSPELTVFKAQESQRQTS